MVTFTLAERVLGRIGRRYWMKRISAALNRAFEQGVIDSWTLHEIDARAKYHADPGSAYPRRASRPKAPTTGDARDE